jgi:DNA-binding response OmpR family regulator
MSAILVIEDDDGILDLIEAALKHFGHAVVTARDGRDGISKFDRGEFDLVITDLRMPEIDGLGVAQYIRGSSRRRVPIIGMSGTPWLMQSADFDRVLSKPFPLEKLVQSVAAVDVTQAMAQAVA